MKAGFFPALVHIKKFLKNLFEWLAAFTVFCFPQSTALVKITK